MDKQKKVAIYVRVSRVDLHPENQIRELELFAKAAGYDYRIYEEKESTRKTRPVKNEVFQLGCNRAFDMILVYKLDRWARSLQELLNDITILRSNTIEFRSLKDNVIVNDDPHNKLMISILGAFAEFERDIIRERTISGLERAKAQGKVLGRPKGSKDSYKRNRRGYFGKRGSYKSRASFINSPKLN